MPVALDPCNNSSASWGGLNDSATADRAPLGAGLEKILEIRANARRNRLAPLWVQDGPIGS